MNIVKIFLGSIVFIIATYSLLTETELMPYYSFFLGAFILVTGIAELQKDRKSWGYINICISLLVFYASIDSLLM